MTRNILHSLAVMALVSAMGWMTGCEAPRYTIERKSVNGLPTVTATESGKAQAKVDAIDYANRSIALTGPNGKTDIFKVSPSVRNFSQIKKGDTVNIEYYSKIHASLRKSSDMPTSEVTSQVATAALGEKPGIVCSRQAVIEANVEDIDYTTRVVKLKTSTGEIMTLTADAKLKDLDKVKKGDMVVFDYVEALSITVN